MSGKEKITARSSWMSGNDKSLKDAVYMTPSTEFKRCSGNEEELTDMVQLETCVLLTRQGEENGNVASITNSCTIDLRVAPGTLISHIIVVSEARVIEVCGAFGEYLTTVQAQFLDEVDDCAAYCADIRLVPPSPECSLRFARLKRDSEMWLYGVRVIWMYDSGKDVGQASPSSGNGLDLKAVERRLIDSGATLSDKAQDCKQFLARYGSVRGAGEGHTSSLDPLTLLGKLTSNNGSKAIQAQLMSLFSAASEKPNFDKSITCDSLKKQNASSTKMSLHEDRSDFMPEVPEREVEAYSNVHSADEGTCSSCIKSFESILDKKLHLLQNSLLESLDERIAQLQHHQDQQFAQLTNLIKEHMTLNDSSHRSYREGVPDMVQNPPEVKSLNEVFLSQNSQGDYVTTAPVSKNSKNLENNVLETAGDACSSSILTNDRYDVSSDVNTIEQSVSERRMQLIGAKFLSDLNINANKSVLTEDFDTQCEQAIRSMMERFNPPHHSEVISQSSKQNLVSPETFNQT